MNHFVTKYVGAVAAWAAVCFSAGCSWLPPGVSAPEPFIVYRVTLADARLNVVHVRADVFGRVRGGLELRPFANEAGKSLVPIGFSASESGGAPLPAVEREGAWSVSARGNDFSFEYDVVLTIEDRYSPDVRGMMTAIGGGRSRLLGRDVFLVPRAAFAEGVVVDIDLDGGGSVAASSPSTRRRIVVPGVEELPLLMAASGDWRFLERRVGDTDLALAIGGAWSFGDEEFFDVVCRIVGVTTAMFGPCPRARHLFICDANPVQGGARFDYYGIHYGGSMLLLLDANIDRSALMDAPMAVVAHEFIHNWNGEAVVPADDGFLWFTEGATSYFSYRVLREAGVISAGQLASRREAIGGRYRGNPLARAVAVADAGNSDMGDKMRVNLLYDGGYLAAEALDGRLRAETGGAVELIDVLRRLCELTPAGGRVDEAALVAVAREYGVDIAPFLRDLVHVPDPAALREDASPLE